MNQHLPQVALPPSVQSTLTRLTGGSLASNPEAAFSNSGFRRLQWPHLEKVSKPSEIGELECSVTREFAGQMIFNKFNAIILNPPGGVEHDEGSLDVCELAIKVRVDQIKDIVSGGKADQEERE